MLKFVIKQLLHDKANTIITLLALSASIAVIVVLQGFEQGQYEQLKLASTNRGSDLIAVQAKVNNFMATRSVIPQLAREQIEAVPGVKAAHPLTTLPVIYRHKGMQTPIYLIVFDSTGGPSNLLAGEVKNRGRGIVIDRSLAKKYDLHIGDEFIVANFAFSISGITSEAAFMTPFAFINYDGLIDFFLDSDIASDLSTFPLVSFLLIETDPKAPLEKIRQTIEGEVTSVDLFTLSEMAKNDVKLGQGFYKPILGLLVSVGFLLGSLLIGLLMFSAAHRQQRDFAVMLALGFKAHHLFGFTLCLSSVLLLLSAVLGLLLADFIGHLIESARPVYYFAVFHPQVLTKAGIIVGLFALLGAVAPYGLIRKSDPITALHRAS